MEARQPVAGRRCHTGLAVASCLLALAACGSAGKSGGAVAGADPLLKLAECMRSHGVPDFPDPGSGGAGLVIPNSIDTRAPAFRSAQQSCARLGLGGQGNSAQGSAGAENRALGLISVARCMRKHGLASFPDPTHSPPPPSSGNVIGMGGLYLALGRGNSPQSPAFRQAAAACRFRIP